MTLTEFFRKHVYDHRKPPSRLSCALFCVTVLLLYTIHTRDIFRLGLVVYASLYPETQRIKTAEGCIDIKPPWTIWKRHADENVLMVISIRETGELAGVYLEPPTDKFSQTHLQEKGIAHPEHNEDMDTMAVYYMDAYAVLTGHRLPMTVSGPNPQDLLSFAAYLFESDIVVEACGTAPARLEQQPRQRAPLPQAVELALHSE